MAEHTNTWFDDQARSLWEKHVLPVFGEGQWCKYLEIGVYEGQSMEWVLKNLSVNQAVGIDPWVGRRKKWKSVMPVAKQTAFSTLAQWLDDGTLELIEGYSHDELGSLPTNNFNLVYIDGDHRAPEAMLDVCLSFRNLSLGGMMIIDDLNRDWVRGRPQVLPVVHAIPMLFHGRLELAWKEGRQIAFSKIDG